MMQQEELAVVPAEKSTVSLGVLPTGGPSDVITKASGIATQLAQIVNQQKLYTVIGGKKHVRVEGWTTLGAMLGVLPREVVAVRLEDGSYEAVVELVRVNDGAVIGRGSAVCGMDEKDKRGRPTWANRAEYARRSMAITRATGKAYRLAFSWIMALAGYEPTPAEEMEGVIEGEFKEKQKPKPEKKRGNDGGNSPHSDYDPIPDIEALALGEEFNKAAINDLGYNHTKHVVNTLNQELGQAWGKRFTKTHLWKTLEAHQGAKEADDATADQVLAEALGAPVG